MTNKDSKNFIGHNLGRGNLLNKKDLLNLIDIIEKYLKTELSPSLKDLSKVIASEQDRRKIISTVAFSKSNLKDDVELMERLLKIVNNYSKSLSDLSKKIDSELPDVIGVNTNNLNVKLAFSLVNIGVFFTYYLPLTLSYYIGKYYTGSTTDTNGLYRTYIGMMTTLADIIDQLPKINFKELIDMIGKFPTIKGMSTGKLDLPSTVVLEYMKKNLKVSNKFITSFVVKALNLLKSDRRKTKKVNTVLKDRIGTVGFVGNPIFHIRIFLTDLEVNRLERLKDEKRLLELKIAELKAKQDGSDDPKIRQQIAYYENKLKRIDEKIDAILEDVKLNQRAR
jgi:hypothetical protein